MMREAKYYIVTLEDHDGMLTDLTRGDGRSRGIMRRNHDTHISLLDLIEDEGLLTSDNNKARIAGAKREAIEYYDRSNGARDARTRDYAAILGDNDVFLLINDDGSFDLVHLDENCDIDDVVTNDSILERGVNCASIVNKKTRDKGKRWDIHTSIMFHGAVLSYMSGTYARGDRTSCYTLIDKCGTWKTFVV